MFSGLKKGKNDSEKEVYELEAYINALWQFLPLPICYLNPLHTILDVNKSFCDFSGYSISEIIGEDLSKLFSNGNEVEEFKKEILEKEKIPEKEMIFLTKEKREIPVLISAAQRIDEKGEFIGYFISIFDISERKKFEEKLKKEIEEKTKELQKKIEELEKFQKIAVGRELKMIELKEEIKKLKEELEKYKGRRV